MNAPGEDPRLACFHRGYRSLLETLVDTQPAEMSEFMSMRKGLTLEEWKQDALNNLDERWERVETWSVRFVVSLLYIALKVQSCIFNLRKFFVNFYDSHFMSESQNAEESWNQLHQKVKAERDKDLQHLLADHERKRRALEAELQTKRDALNAEVKAKRDALETEIIKKQEATRTSIQQQWLDFERRKERIIIDGLSKKQTELDAYKEKLQKSEKELKDSVNELSQLRDNLTQIKRKNNVLCVLTRVMAVLTIVMALVALRLALTLFS